MQISLFVHAVLLLNAEAPRKDHWQMMTHHVVTVILIVASYAYNFTRVGCLIMVIMDWCDIFLPVLACLPFGVLKMCLHLFKARQDVTIPFVPDRLRRNFCVVDVFVGYNASCIVL
jgi:hypothetical protein